MKNLTKIFMAVVVAMAAYACASDPTEDLGYQLGNNEGQTTLSLSLEESRTQLGSKVGDKYPIYWSAGDKIAVNGVTSNEVVVDAENASKGSFTLNGELTYPYNVVYPAPAEGATVVTEGCYPVTFLQNQTYTEGSFCEGATPMYGYAEEGQGVSLHHLTGVLRVAMVGTGETLTSMVVKSEEGKIAGNFDVDCKSGALVAHEDATNVVVVDFGENGLTLGAEATPIYVTVPSGDYGIFVVSLYTANDSMTIRFDSNGDKAIKAGVVREFKEVAYVANAGASEVFEIYDEVSLRKFAATAHNFYPYKSAKVVATINMEGKEWTPIEGFGEFLFDGGKNEGFEIKGLTAPLFGSTSAQIKNVNLTGVNITESVNPQIGALARRITSNGTEPLVVENCSASGTITVNCTEFEPATSSVVNISIAGLVGVSTGASFTNCSNSVDLDVQQVVKTDVASDSTATVGGVVALLLPYKLADGTESLAACTDCENLGDITFTDNTFTGTFSVEGTNGVASKVSTYIGGVIGHEAANTTQGVYNAGATISGLVNRGAITASAKGCTWLTVGGVIGDSRNPVKSGLENYGAVTINNSNAIRVWLGGVIGCHQDPSANIEANPVLQESYNHGAVTLNSVGGRDVYVAGVAAFAKHHVKSCENNGVITAVANMPERSGSFGSEHPFAVGGVVGATDPNLNTTEIDGCKNNESGSISVSGMLRNVNGKAGQFGFGGVAGVLASVMTNSSNAGDIEVSGTNTCIAGKENYGGIAVGGVAGSNTTVSNNVAGISNSGSVTLKSGTYAGTVYVAGVVGYAAKRLSCENGTGSHAINEGDVTICAKGESVEFQSASYIAGCAGIVGNDNACDMDNKGSLTINNGTTISGGDCYVGGVFGFASGIATRAKNEGAINVGGTYSQRLVVGGVLGERVNTTDRIITSLTNSGDITFKSGLTVNNPTGADGTTTELHIPIGGVVGSIVNQYDDNIDFKVCTNAGAITFESDATFNSVVKVGGVVGGLLEKVDFGTTTCNNTGNLTFGATFSKRLLVGGFAAHMVNPKVSYASGSTLGNNGNLLFTSDFKSTLSDEENDTSIGGYVGLFSGESISYYLKQVVNTGSITFEDGASVKNHRAYISGLVGKGDGGCLITTKNTGTITIGGTFDKMLAVGGLIGFNVGTTVKDGTSVGGTNEGAITITSDAECNKYTAVGGAVGVTKFKFGNNLTNKAAISVSGTHKVDQFRVAGGIGWHVNGSEAVNNLTNNGSVTIKSDIDCTSVGGIHIAGGVAYQQDHIKNLVNTGAVTVEDGAKLSATSNSGCICVGGAIGETRLTITGLTNTGKVSVLNPDLKSFVAGAFGFMKTGGVNASGIKVFCDIVAYNCSNIGMITGSGVERQVTNSHIGGTIDKGRKKYSTDPITNEEVYTWVADMKTLSAENYFNYLYSVAIEASVAADNSCGYISAIDAQPVDSAGNAITLVE